MSNTNINDHLQEVFDSIAKTISDTDEDKIRIIGASSCKDVCNKLPHYLDDEDEITHWEAVFKNLGECALSAVEENAPEWESLKGNLQVDLGLWDGSMRIATDEEAEKYRAEALEAFKQKRAAAYAKRIKLPEEVPGLSEMSI